MIYVPLIVEKILNRVGLLSFFRFGYSTRILTKSFRIPVIENKEGLNYFQTLTEPYLLTMLKSIYSKGSFLFLDVGVNFGQTLLKVKSVSHECDYIGFEPSGLCSYYVSNLIRVNKLEKCRLVKCALSNVRGIVVLQGYSDGDTRATIVNNLIPPKDVRHAETVISAPLDDFSSLIEGYKKEVILKVDVEGAELLVFEGGENLIKKFRPIVFFECLPSLAIEEREQQQFGITQFFERNGYSIYLMDEAKMELNKIDLIQNEGDYARTNFIGIPNEKKKLLIDESTVD